MGQMAEDEVEGNVLQSASIVLVAGDVDANHVVDVEVPADAVLAKGLETVEHEALGNDQEGNPDL